MKKIITLLLPVFLAASLSLADTPPPSIVGLKGGTDNSKIGNVGDALKVTFTGSLSSTVNQGNAGVSPWLITGNVGRTWNLLNTTDSVNVGNFPASFGVTQLTNPWAVSQSGVWNTGRTWNLLNTTDSVNVGNFPSSFIVNQGTSPWLTSRSWNLSSGSDSVSVAGSVTANIGTTGGLALDSSILNTQGSVTGGGSASFSNLAGGRYSSTLPTLTNGQQSALQLNSNGALRTDGSAYTQPVSGSVSVSNFPSNQTVSGVVTSNQGTANSLANAWPAKLTDGVNPVAVTGSNALKVDNSGVTQPVSGSVSVSNLPSTYPVTQSGSWSTGRTWTLNSGTDSVSIVGSISATNPSVGVNNAAGPSSSTQVAGQDSLGNLKPLKVNGSQALLVDGSAVTQPVSGSVSVSNFPATQNVAVTNTPTVNAAQSGSWTVTANVGTTNGLALDNSVKETHGTVSPGTAATKSELAGAQFNTVAPTLTNGQQAALQSNVNGALKVDGSAYTQPVNGTVTSNIGTTGGLALDSSISSLSGKFGTLGQKTMAGSAPVAIASDQSAIPVTGTFWQSVQPVSQSGAWTATVSQSTGTNLHTVVDSGTVTANIGTPGGLALDTSVQNLQVSQNLSTTGQKGTLNLGAVTTTAPSYTSGQSSALSLTPAGALRTDSSATTQPVSGTVNATQSGSWSVGQGTPSPASGAWPIKVTDGTNTASVKPAATAPLVSDPSLVVSISPNSPITVTSVPPVVSTMAGSLTAACASGTSCAVGSTVQITTDGYTTLGFETHGIWTGAITQDVSFDPLCSSTPNAVIWYPTAAFDTDSNESFYVTTWGNSKNNDPWVMNVSTAYCARLRAVSLTSGQVDLTMNAGVGTAVVWSITTGNAASGSTDVGNPVKVGGVYNSSLPTLSTGQRGDAQLDSNARLIVSPLTNSSVVKSQLQDNAGNALTSQVSGSQRALDVGINVSGVQVDPRTRTWTISSGTDSATVVQGTAAALSGKWPVQVTDGTNVLPTMDAASRAGFQKVTDGTNTTAVKAASTAALATDPSLVVAVSPNSPLPTGSNVIGDVGQSGGPWSQNVTQFGGNAVVTGTGTSGVGIPRVTVSSDSNILATQSGVWSSRTQDGSGNNLTSQVSGSQRALDVGINVSGVQVDPRTRTWTLSSGTDSATVVQGTAAALSGKWPVQVTDGTNTQPTMDAAARAGFQKVTDGTNTTAVKAASTAALATDPSLVVALSPNSPIPTGSNVIGNVGQNGGPWSQNVTQFGSSAVVTGTGAGGAGIPRVTVSNDSNVLATQSGTWTVQQGSGPWSQNVTQFGGTNISTGTGVGGAGIPRVTVSSDSNILATQSGTWTVQQGSAPWSVVGNVASGSADSGNPLKIGGVFNTTQPTFTNGQRGDLQMSSRGALIVAGGAGDGVAPINSALHVAGVDGGGLKRTILTDTSGRQQMLLNDSAGTGVTLGQKTMASSLPVTIASDQPLPADVSASGNITSTQNVQLTLRGTHGASVLVTGTWSGTLVFELSQDGTTWIQAETYLPLATGAENTASSTTTNGTFVFTTTAGMGFARVRGNTVSSGTAVVSLLGTQSNFNIQTSARENGSSVPTYGSMIAGSDGSNTRFVQTDSNGRIATTSNASYANISTATTTTVKSGAGVLFAICWNKLVNNATDTIYDSTTGSGTTIGTVTEIVGGGAAFPSGCETYSAGVNFSTGLTIVTSAASNLTVIYK